MLQNFRRYLKFKLLKKAYFSLSEELFCPVCERKVPFFYPFPKNELEKFDKFQYIYPLHSFETFNYTSYSCPYCNSPDRDRLYAYYFKNRFSKLKEKIYVLDIAPSDGLSVEIKKYPLINYTIAGLNRSKVDDYVDIQNMKNYSDSSFDVIFCSHVLEHVPDDKKAAQELFRVLKPGGWGIIMVPICLSLNETSEDQSIMSEADRWKFFCQNDHVRLYSKYGFTNLLLSAGFIVKNLDQAYFGIDTFKKMGINYKSVLYLVEKEVE